MEVDFMTQRELNRLSRELKSNQKELEADKSSFADKLLNELGVEILNGLEKPKKINIFQKLILKFRRWITVKKYDKLLKKTINQYKDYELDNDFKNDFYE